MLLTIPICPLPTKSSIAVEPPLMTVLFSFFLYARGEDDEEELPVRRLLVAATTPVFAVILVLVLWLVVALLLALSLSVLELWLDG